MGNKMKVSGVTTDFDSRKFRNILGAYPTGVTVVTASVGKNYVGITANSFSSLSLDPPLILWSIIKTSSSFEIFKSATHFAINILAWDQINLSNKFAKSGSALEKFKGVPVEMGKGGGLILPNTSASIECRTVSILDAGDHWLFIGEVENFQDNCRPSLAFYKGKYNVMESHPDHTQPVINEHSLYF